MKSDVCKLSKELNYLHEILTEVEKTAAYNKLDEKNVRRLRLIAEELCGMLPGLIKDFNGEFWTESKGNEYELHVELRADSMDAKMKRSLIDFSSSEENAAAKGIMGKIREVAANMLLNDPELDNLKYNWSDGWSGNYGWCDYDPMISASFSNSVAWSLAKYQSTVEENKDEDAMEELERSIVAKLSDDIIVGVRGKNVELIVKKAF